MVALLCGQALLHAQGAEPLQALAFLEGDWEGEGAGSPGEAKGGFSFRGELENHVLVRRNYAEYPATKDRPASRHEDLMIVHPEADGKIAAQYFDNEGHVIRYRVSVSNHTATFLSDAAAAAPHYRLTYSMKGKDAVSIRFEIAPPGKPEDFKVYLTAAAHKKR